MYKVLIVDDEPAMIELLKRVIDEFIQFELVGEAYMVSEAKLLLEREVPDIIISDICMPGANGLDLIRFVSEKYPNIVMFVVSGYDTFDYVRTAFRYGVEDYLLKPVPPNDFRVFLEGLLIKLGNRNITVPKIKSGNSNSSSPEKNMLRDIESYLVNNLEDTNYIDQICKVFGINQPQLNKLFRQRMGCTYNEHLTTLRIAKAKQLLWDRKDLLIGTVARLCGFSDQFYFSKVFKNNVGMPPSEFRMGGLKYSRTT